MMFATHLQETESLLQSVDLAVRDLLASENDPVALAMYLWTVRQHDIALVNADGLAVWCASWARRVLIDRVVGPRRDDDVAAAALSVVALAGTAAFHGEEAEVQSALREVLVFELERERIPLRRPAYGSVLFLAACMLGMDGDYLRNGARAVGAAFEQMIASGRVFGLGFAVALLNRVRVTELLAPIAARIHAALADPRVAYEDQLYLIQALWLLDGVHSSTEPLIADMTEQVLANSPVWSYLMVGLEDVPPAGQRGTVVPLSHLCRAVLLDVTLRFRRDAAGRAEAAVDARYRGRRIVGLCAFGFSVSVLASLWFLLAWLMVPNIEGATRYWLLNEYSAISPQAAVLFLLEAILVSFVAPVTPVVLWTTWSLLARSAVESDRRILEVLLRRSWRVAQAWGAVFLIAAMVNLQTGLITEALRHTISVSQDVLTVP